MDHADYVIMRPISGLLLLMFVSFTEHVGSLVLTSSPLTATDGELFTLICSSNTTGGHTREWNRDGGIVITTVQGSSSLSVSNPNIFNMYLSGRVNVSCDATQHNVTLRINSTVDNGSVWQCVDNAISQRSNMMTINVTVHQTTTSPNSVSVSTISLTTTTTSSAAASSMSAVPSAGTSTSSRSISTPPLVTTTQQCPACATSPSGAYVAAGTVGGAVFGSVITAVVVALWMHKKNKNKDATTPNIYASTSAYEDVDHQYAMAPRQHVNSVEGIETTHYVNTERDGCETAYYNTTQ